MTRVKNKKGSLNNYSFDDKNEINNNSYDVNNNHLQNEKIEIGSNYTKNNNKSTIILDLRIRI